MKVYVEYRTAPSASGIFADSSWSSETVEGVQRISPIGSALYLYDNAEGAGPPMAVFNDFICYIRRDKQG